MPRATEIRYSITYLMSSGGCQTGDLNAADALTRYHELLKAGATGLVISEGVRRISIDHLVSGVSWMARERLIH